MARSRQTTTEYLDELQQEAEQAMLERYEEDLAWQDAAEYEMDDDDWDYSGSDEDDEYFASFYDDSYDPVQQADGGC